MLSNAIGGLISSLKNEHLKTAPITGHDDARIKVNKLTNKAGALYEKLRYFVDYKEEHTIRRSAIERIIKRKVLIEIDNNVGRSLLEELVSGGYLPNDRISETVAGDVQRIFNRFLLVKESIGSKLLENIKLKSRLINLSATEIDLFLFPTPNDELVVEAFHGSVKGLLRYSGELSPVEFDRQVYSACRRLLLKNDDSSLFYFLWLRSVPTWSSIATFADLEKTQIDFYALIRNITGELEDPIRFQLQSKLRNHGLYFSVLKEIVDKYGAESEHILLNKSALGENTASILEKKYSKENSRIRKSGTRAIIYVFFTKIILAFLVELPYELFVIHALNPVSLVANITFHPFLLFVMTRNIKPLGKRNTEKINIGLQAVIDGSDTKKMTIKLPSTGFFLGGVFFLFYVILFLLSFGVIAWFLILFEFNLVSSALFLLFLTFVSYFGLRIRHNSENWRVRGDEESTLTLIWNLFTFPIIRMGRYMSVKFSSINIFVFFMDFILEVPFKLLLTTSDSFLSFLREKREETY